MDSPYEAAFIEADVSVPEEEEEFPLSLDTQGLLAVGALTQEVDVQGHKIVLRTLKVGEELEASLASSKYRDTDDAGRAFATAIVAASVQSVDGQPMMGALGPNDNTIQARFEWVRANWYWPVVRTLYSHYGELQERVNESLEDLSKN